MTVGNHCYRGSASGLLWKEIQKGPHVGERKSQTCIFNFLVSLHLLVLLVLHAIYIHNLIHVICNIWHTSLFSFYFTPTHIFKICCFVISKFYMLYSYVLNVLHTRPKWRAEQKWISSHLRWTVANWYMVHTITQGTNTTCSCTWIFTFIIDASTVIRTICVKNTLWSTCQVRVTKVLRFANTC